MRFEITPEIRQVVVDAIDSAGHGAICDYARRYGIRQQALSKIYHGHSAGVQEDLWLRLRKAFPAIGALEKPRQQVGMHTYASRLEYNELSEIAGTIPASSVDALSSILGTLALDVVALDIDPFAKVKVLACIDKAKHSLDKKEEEPMEEEQEESAPSAV